MKLVIAYHNKYQIPQWVHPMTIFIYAQGTPGMWVCHDMLHKIVYTSCFICGCKGNVLLALKLGPNQQ